MKQQIYTGTYLGEDTNNILVLRYEDTYPDECSITVMATV